MDSLKNIDLSLFSLENTIQTLLEMASRFAIRLAIAILIFIIGKWIISYIKKIFTKILDKRDTDPSLKSFLKSLVSIALTIILIIIIVGILGVETTSIVALLASAGVAFGMALSGTLQNFAGGVMILFFKPYRVGDFIEAQNQSGTVKEIQIFNTVLITPDNKVIFIPNGSLATGVVINYSRQKIRRFEIIINIAYGENYDKARDTIIELLNENKLVLKEPAHFVALNKLNDSSVDIVVRAWADKDNYWDAYFSINENVYKAFAEKGIDIPFPQLTVHMKKNI